ncbi:hypothetical protein Nepgr_013494 [Nepenthes gracilis]|uniref:Uncharacterized protein n=1 Tax=Nepenthes gracilis TaxID=150966 RepID=A0AAD3XP24_NEPGR|nr:hypothetical protein Nepgr_013494 [Nepenthes gracilis]
MPVKFVADTALEITGGTSGQQGGPPLACPRNTTKPGSKDMSSHSSFSYVRAAPTATSKLQKSKLATEANVSPTATSNQPSPFHYHQFPTQSATKHCIRAQPSNPAPGIP